MALPIGSKAPAFRAQTDSGEWLRLSDLHKDRMLVLYFYPQDHTETCTKQACAFEESIHVLEDLGLRVVGLSPDTVASHQKFRSDYALSFSLLSDPDRKICELYDVWKEKTLYGRTYMGVVRTTFLIDKKGRIIDVYEYVRMKGHIEKISARITRYVNEGK